MTVEQAQTALAAVADALGETERALETILAELPPSEQEDAILEHQGPFDRATEIRSVIECALADNIRPAFAELWAAALATDDQLLARWRERRA